MRSAGQLEIRRSGIASLLLLAWRGHEAPALHAIESSLRDATARGEGRAIGLAHYATAVLYNGLGRYEDALAAAQRACAYEDLGFFGWALVELIEAGVRSDGRTAQPTPCGNSTSEPAPAVPTGRLASGPARWRS